MRCQTRVAILPDRQELADCLLLATPLEQKCVVFTADNCQSFNITVLSLSEGENCDFKNEGDPVEFGFEGFIYIEDEVLSVSGFISFRTDGRPVSAIFEF